jgi:hypothetical protein
MNCLSRNEDGRGCRRGGTCQRRRGGGAFDRVLQQPPAFLERFVIKLLLAIAYGGRESAAEHVGPAGDEGSTA